MQVDIDICKLNYIVFILCIDGLPIDASFEDPCNIQPKINFGGCAGVLNLAGCEKCAPQNEVNSALECCAICRQIPGCIAWTFYHTARRCWPRNNLPTGSKSDDATSGQVQETKGNNYKQDFLSFAYPNDNKINST